MTTTCAPTRCTHIASTHKSEIPGWALYNMTCQALRLSSIVDSEAPPLFCPLCGRPSDDVEVDRNLSLLTWGGA